MANKKVSQLTSKPSVLTTDLFPIADPSTGQLYKTTISDLGTAIGSGVSSVNSLVGAVVLDTDDIQELVSPTNKWFTDTRARAALSASSPLTYNSGTGAFGIQVANGSQNGYLSSTDWTTFNAKQAALSGTGFVKSTGGTISYDTNTYLTTSAAASTYLALAGGTMTGVLFGASASFSGYVGFGGNTSPLYQVDVTGSGRFAGDLRIESTNPRIYLTDTDNNPDYFISNTDGTFTVYDVTNSTARFTIGTTGNATFANAITGGGSITGQSLYSNGIISAGTSLSVGTFVSAGGSLTGSALYVTGMTSGSGALYYSSGTNRVTVANYNASGIVTFEVGGGATALTLNANLSATFASGATFSGVGSFSNYISVGGTSGLNIYGTINIPTGEKMILNSYHGLELKTSGGVGSATPISVFNVSTSGAATFSSSVTATSLMVGTTLSNEQVMIGGTGSRGIGISTTTSGDPFLRLYDNTTIKADIWWGRSGGYMGVNSLGAGSITAINPFGGSVGIGTTSPGVALQVNVSNSAGLGGQIALHNSSTAAVGSRTELSFLNDSGASGTGTRSGRIISSMDNAGNGASNMQFWTWSGATDAERMRITSVGHIQTNGNPVYAYSGSISIGGTYQTIFAAVSGGVYLVSVTTDSADGTFGLLTVINDPDKSLGMIYGNNISLQFSGDNVQMKSTNGSTYNTTWTATRLK